MKVPCGHPCFTYRLGDIVYGYLKNTSYVCKRWPHSVGCRYILNHRKNICTLLRSNTSRGFVVHLRLGDVLDWPYYNPHKQCGKIHCHYVHPYEYYRQLSIPKSVTQVTIVGNPQYRMSHKSNDQSRLYLRTVVDIFKTKNVSLTILTNNDADTDLKTMTNAKYFVSGRGGFSKIATQCLMPNTFLYDHKWYRMPNRVPI
jgi:hypothetical protein